MLDLDRGPHVPGLVPFSVEGGRVDAGTAQECNPCRVAGEDAPAWLAAGFAMIGTMIAVASVFAWQQDALGSAPPPSLPAASSLLERFRQSQEDLSPGLPPLVREATSAPQPQPTLDVAPPSTAAGVAPPAVAEGDGPGAATIGRAAASQGPDRRATAADCFGPLTVPFDRNSARPNASDVRKSVEPLRRWLSTHGGALISIEGHSDPTGTEDLNVLLSYSRAKAVAGLLRRAGIPAQQITLRAAGSGEASLGTAGLASDRSALLRIVGVEDCGGVATATKRL